MKGFVLLDVTLFNNLPAADGSYAAGMYAHRYALQNRLA